mmetsp:Transcript_7455/g.20134  ORF Transcript_7455/g.20134 Transcript_7455/m.20134 type:complete len:127 (+) Transcript_7455:2-382(+)
MQYGGGPTAVEQVMFQARFETAQSKLIEKICWQRCTDGLHAGTEEFGAATPMHDRLRGPEQRCLDACVSKFSDVGMVVAAESEMWQANENVKLQQQAIAKLGLAGLAATAVVVGTCCYLFGGKDDD